MGNDKWCKRCKNWLYLKDGVFKLKFNGQVSDTVTSDKCFKDDEWRLHDAVNPYTDREVYLQWRNS